MEFKAKFLTAAYSDIDIAIGEANSRYKGLTPHEITHGHCYEWAIEVAKRLPGAKVEDVNLWSQRGGANLPYHVWVEFKGKVYDAEVPHGTHNWRQLPFFKEHSNQEILPRLKNRIMPKKASEGLVAKLTTFRPQLAAIAQKIYDEWDASDEEYGDAEVGFGGICHIIADGWSDLLANQGYATTTWSHSDEVHVSLMVWEYDSEGQQDVDEEFAQEIEVVDVDLNPHIYEKGGGYNWTKIPDVTINPSDITFYRQFMSPENLEALQEG